MSTNSHVMPENIRRIQRTRMYETDTGDILVRQPHGVTEVYIKVAEFATRREAAEFSGSRLPSAS